MPERKGYWSDKLFAQYAADKKSQRIGDTFVATIQYACKKMGMPYCDYNRLIELSAEYLKMVNGLNKPDSKRK